MKPPRAYATELVSAMMRRQDTQAIRDGILNPAVRQMAELHARIRFARLQHDAKASLADPYYLLQLPEAARAQVREFIALRRGHWDPADHYAPRRKNERLCNARDP
jgi:hypothetical protein